MSAQHPAPVPPRAEPQQQRSRETVGRILAAADVEIGLVGLARTSTRRIAERAGLSVGATYRFFADKEAIAVALSERYLEAAQEAYAPVLAAASGPGDLPEAIAGLVAGAARLHAQFPGYYRLTEERLPGLEASPAHVARAGLVDLFTEALIGLGAAPGEPEDVVRRRVELSIETVRHALAGLDADDAEATEVLVAELSRMLTAYLTAP